MNKLLVAFQNLVLVSGQRRVFLSYMARRLLLQLLFGASPADLPSLWAPYSSTRSLTASAATSATPRVVSMSSDTIADVMLALPAFSLFTRCWLMAPVAGEEPSHHENYSTTNVLQKHMLMHLQVPHKAVSFSCHQVAGSMRLASTTQVLPKRMLQY